MQTTYPHAVLLGVLIATFAVWLAFVCITSQDPDTLDFGLRPWARKVLKWWRGS